MLWICGLDLIFRYLGKHFDAAWLKWMGAQMEHPAWEGFTLYDLIFPLFVFIVGISLWSDISNCPVAASRWDRPPTWVHDPADILVTPSGIR